MAARPGASAAIELAPGWVILKTMTQPAVPGFRSRYFWFQIRALTVANLKSRYRKTIAGFLWVILNPLIMYGVQALVFMRFLRIQVPHYAVFLVAGLIPWVFIHQTLEMCTSIFVANGRMLKSFQVDPLVYLISQVADNLLNFLAAYLLVLIPLWGFGGRDFSVLLLLPLPITLLVAGVAGMSWLLATWQVFLRDTRFVVTFTLSISYFLTPIFYPVSYVPPALRIFVEINPFYRLILPFQVLLYNFSWERFLTTLLFSLLISVGFFGWALITWGRKRNDVYFNV
jgi:ABC-type polysaccharide/polyol phosphate export permease